MTDRAKEMRKTRRIIGKEKKVQFMVPLEEGEKYGAVHDVFINGCHYPIKKGVLVEIPSTIAQLLCDHYNQKLEVKISKIISKIMNLFKRKNKYGGEYPIKKIKVRTGREWSFKKTGIISLVIIVLAIIGLYQTNKFFDAKTLVFKAPAEVKFNAPISIAERVREVTVQIIENDGLPLTENERYLCKKFGDQCKTALEIQRRENVKGNCEAFYVNNNGTIDLGFMQINSVHLSKEVTLAQLVDCKSNIDIAYDIYKRDGWKAWVAAKKL